MKKCRGVMSWRECRGVIRTPVRVGVLGVSSACMHPNNHLVDFGGRRFRRGGAGKRT